MRRDPQYQFFDMDADKLIAGLVAKFEQLTGAVVHPASPEKLYIQWVGSVILQERALANVAANQNIPSRAEGKNLDALGELFYAVSRPEATPAVCTERCYVSEPQKSAILIPAGTRVTDAGKTLIWETVKDAYLPAGEAYIDLLIQCQTPGTVGNDYSIGQINTIVDVYDYYDHCENITVSDSGSDQPDDNDFYALLRASMDGYSTAGGMGNYIYHARQVSTDIADVVANSPSRGEVRMYVLMRDGTPGSEEIKAQVLSACNADTVRPLTDHVLVNDPTSVRFDIDFTYWVNQDSGAAEIQRKVHAAVHEYTTWQCAKLGRDINPSYLVGLLMQTGVKRVDLRSPVFTPLQDGKLSIGGIYPYEKTVPQVAAVGMISIVSGGYEDE